MQPIHLRDQITVEHHLDLGRRTREFRETILDDRHVLYLPLRHGKVTVISNGKRLHDALVLPGMMRLSSPGEEVCTTVHAAFDVITLTLPGGVLREAVRMTNATHRPGRFAYIDPLLKPNFQVQLLGRALLHAIEFDTMHSQLFVVGLTYSLLACLLQHHRTKPRVQRPSTGMEPTEFEQAAAFAGAHIEGALKLPEWAASLGMRPGEFTRRFRHTTGVSPYAWFMQRRIEWAKELLRQPKNSLCDVALSCGFSSQSHFTAAFHRRVGSSPARWRQAAVNGI
jgi:AraC-like DNA-binding protein